MYFKHQSDVAERPSEANRFRAILLVDDNRELVQALQWVFADQNFLVDKAYDGEEALLKVKANVYDAVVCDVMMPRLRGDEFYVQAVQSRPELADRFIFITGFAADAKVQRFLADNHLTCFVKPVRMPQLVKCVEMMVA
jgi:response regulator RpfG family c-di-GMP phosphodiesterase